MIAPGSIPTFVSMSQFCLVLAREDTPMVRKLIEALMAREDCEQVLFTDPDEGMTFFNDNQKQIASAIIDLSVAGMNGLEWVDRIHREAPHLPITILTGDRTADENEIRRHGVRHIVHKPTTAEANDKATNPMKTIVLVEDDEAVSEVLKAFIERRGCKSISYTHPDEALTFLEKEHRTVDGVIVDLTLPGMTGLELADRIHRLSPGKPVTIITGELSFDETEAKKHGVKRLIHKPVTKDEFNEALREMVQAGEISEKTG